MENKDRKFWLIIICFAVVYLVWGSTYLVNYFAIQDIPPFLTGGSRFFVAGLILYVITYLLGAKKPTWKQWKNTAITGILFLSIGAGGVIWAEQFVDTGIAALIVSFEPLLVVLLLWYFRAQKPNWKVFLGVFLGIIGMVVLVGQQQFLADENTIWGILAIGISIIAWAFASIYIQQIELPESQIQGAAMQMIAGGITLFMVSALIGDFGHFNLAAVSTKAALSWLYLVFFGSIIAFSAFNYLLVHVSPDKVATSTYVHPVVALILGSTFNNEIISTQSLIATVILLTGVFFINMNKQKGRVDSKKQNITPAPRSMIARIWWGTVPMEKAKDYIDLTKRRAIPDYRKAPGNLGLTFLQRTEGAFMHLTLISYWKDLDSVIQFAGEDYQKARYHPDDDDFLVDKLESVVHHEVFAHQTPMS